MEQQQTFLGGDRVKRRLFDSSTICEAKYDSVLETLEVTFQNGTKYEYFGVDEALATAFWEAGSPGRFFTQNIRPLKSTKLV